MNPIIKVENLSKQYRIGAARASYSTLRESLMATVRAPLRRVRDVRAADAMVWALKDVSFEVLPGEVVGIIGRNGAGKSTLLKILARITEPTRGRARIRGRVGSLLEVGTGFHPELTGRENIYLNGAILGMKKTEIERKFDEIVAFSEVEKFLDTPVKHYSSGMYLRLAFGVAAHLEPEILIVDEVLAVGDAAFQKKCLGKMGDVAKEGRTVLFVSHNMGAISTLCSESVLINEGSVVLVGRTKDVIRRYLGSSRIYSPLRNRNMLQDNGDVKLITPRVMQDGVITSIVDCRRPFRVEISYEIVHPIPHSRFFLILRNERGEVIFTTSDYDELTPEALNRSIGRYQSSVSIPANLLKTGTIYGTVGADIRSERIIFAADDIFEVDVIESGSDVVDTLSERHIREGAVAPILKWTILSLDNRPVA